VARRLRLCSQRWSLPGGGEASCPHRDQSRAQVASQPLRGTTLSLCTAKFQYPSFVQPKPRVSNRAIVAPTSVVPAGQNYPDLAPWGCFWRGASVHPFLNAISVTFKTDYVLFAFAWHIAKMFYSAVKNPLESETVGQRRERKAKESEGSVLSSRSSASVKETKSTKASNFSVFGALRKTPKIPKAAPDGSRKISVTQSVDVAASELEAPRDLLSPTWVFSGSLPPSRGYSELSASPSVNRPGSI
jgi:hypothetical protein